MELITPRINKYLKKLIKDQYLLIKEENKSINHINIYHRDLQNNNCKVIIKILKNEYLINTDNIISLGFITS